MTLQNNKQNYSSCRTVLMSWKTLLREAKRVLGSGDATVN